MKQVTHTIKEISTAVILLTMLIMAPGCKKAVEVPVPSTSLVGANVFTDNKTATAVLTGIYDNMHSNSSFSDGSQGIATYMGTAADEMRNYYIGTASKQFYTNELSASPGTYFWPQFFKYIYVANTAIEGVAAAAGLSKAVKDQLTGEAKFVRAFMNFYAVNLYGDIPLVTSVDYNVNNRIKRSSQSDIYKTIIADLLSAQQLLTDDYKDAFNEVSTEKIRPNKEAATALLARAYLYTADWKNAEIQASLLIGNTSYGLVANLDQVFLKNSKEAIWQLASANPSFTNTIDAYYFVMKTTPGTSHHIVLTPNLLNVFELNDNRRARWVGIYTKGTSSYYYPYKYKNNQTGSAVTENLMMLRLGEQYLIRAEARARQDKPTAIDDLNAIRNRAGLGNYSGATTQIPLLAAILHERQVELFSEWGHRWFDLKRTGNLDAIMGGPAGVTALKGGTWTSADALLPLPVSEIQINPNLTQNPGYK